MIEIYFYCSVQPFAAVADPYGDQVKVKIQVSRISNEDIRTVILFYLSFLIAFTNTK